ncbi:MAG: anti-phage dCTP deaminase [Sulfuritalea sp.]|nr:anti-phage dCTP deaminase [Sulfuritalea sp.]
MAEAAQKKSKKSTSASQAALGFSDKRPQEAFESRRSQELVIGFAGPIGCGISSVIDETVKVLQGLNYEIHHIKLSKFIQDAITANTVTVSDLFDPVRNRAHHYFSLQDGGNELRKNFGFDILAEWAIREIVLRRGKDIPPEEESRPKDFVPKRVAYLIDQIKHQDEVLLLRKVYRGLFHLVGVISVYDNRQKRLTTGRNRVPKAQISELMERDRKQEEDNGQQLDKALQMADFFIRSDRGTVAALNHQMERFLALLHGKNGLTPTRLEYGMYMAYAAGLRSACLARQVGAAIANVKGEIVATGCNDVPKSGGGLYSTEDGTADKRCVHREEQNCFNDREKLQLKQAMEDAIRQFRWKPEKGEEVGLPEQEVPKLLNKVYSASRTKDLIEFSRAVHAEMDAIVSLARTGTSATRGGVLYTTTFPCHSCARHIVASGISKVYYIEPYEKSLAQNLHSDAIAFDTEDEDAKLPPAESPGPLPPVKFIHFEGIAPRQYLDFFKMTVRKDDRTGKVVQIIPNTAEKSVTEYLDDYRDFESKVVDHLETVLPGANSEQSKNSPSLQPVA